MRTPLRRMILVLVLLVAPRALAAEQGAARVDVILWFDTEDYLLPADDDACKRLAELLTQRDIRATFKVVGEKARVLEKRGRTDVIDALRKHDIAFHSNLHSVHPTPTEYLAECGLLDGMAEFVRREGRGAADVRRVFHVDSLSCYGQPGSSWASQAIAALPQVGVSNNGVPCYVDSGTHVGLNSQPFWYAGALVVYNMRSNETRFDLHAPAALEVGKKTVSEVADRLRSEGGGLISIFYHPCEWVHREFWDGVNFRRGANPSREDWKPPPQRSAEETDQAFARFASYIDHIRTLPGVHFVTAKELPLRYPDPVRTLGATERDLDTLAERLAKEGGASLYFQLIENRAYSPADQFELLTLAVSALIEKKPVKYPLAARGLLGPDGLPPASIAESNRTIPWPAFRDAVRDVRDYVEIHRRVPPRVFFGADPVPPADFLGALAWVYLSHAKRGEFPDHVTLPRDIPLGTVKHIAADTPGLFGGWVIHKENFRAPKVLEIARLQSWTLKPALRQAN